MYSEKDMRSITLKKGCDFISPNPLSPPPNLFLESFSNNPLMRSLASRDIDVGMGGKLFMMRLAKTN